jgi:hypothetical protein
MAYPYYSIVIIEKTVNGVTDSETKIYESVAEANREYRKAIADGNRAYLYEQPTATKYNKNNLQPFPQT